MTLTAACHHHRHQRFCVQTFSLQPPIILSTILVNSTTSFMWKEVLEVGILVIFWWALLHSVCAGHYELLPCRLASDCPRHHQPPPTASDFTTFQLPTIIISHCSQSQWRSSPSPPQLGHHDFTSDNGAGDGHTIIRYFPLLQSAQWKCEDLNFKSLLYSHLYLSSNINICPCRNQGGKYNYRLRWILSIKTFSVSQPDSRSLSFSTINSIIYYIKICVVYYIGNKTRRKASFV